MKLNLNLGYDVLSSKHTKDVPQLAGMMYTSHQKDGTGLAYNAQQDKRNYLLDAYADYNHTFAEKHSFGIMAGYGWQHFWKKFNSETWDTEMKNNHSIPSQNTIYCRFTDV